MGVLAGTVQLRPNVNAANNAPEQGSETTLINEDESKDDRVGRERWPPGFGSGLRYRILHFTPA